MHSNVNIDMKKNVTASASGVEGNVQYPERKIGKLKLMHLTL